MKRLLLFSAVIALVFSLGAAVYAQSAAGDFTYQLGQLSSQHV